MTLSPALAAMLDEVFTVGTPVDAVPGTGATVGARTYSGTRTIQGRIESASGGLSHLPEGVRMETTELLFADSDAALVEGEIVKAEGGHFYQTHWEVLYADPVNGHHFEVALKRLANIADGERL